MSVVTAPVPELKTIVPFAWGGFGISLVAHAMLVGICTAIAIVAPHDAVPRDEIVISTVAPTLREPAPMLIVPEWRPVHAGGTTAPAAVRVEASVSNDHAPTLSSTEGVALTTGTDLSYSENIGEIGNGGGTGDGVGDGTGEGFFGLELAGDKFVFVVDASRSMNFPYPGEAKNRLGRVKIELLNTVSRMNAEQQFFVIFFNTEPIPMPAPGFIYATPGVSRPLMEWVFRTKGTGQTDPEQALLMALRLNPDRIYFLTDGGFSYRSVRSVREANRRLVPIHTIGFGGREGEQNLQEIARDSRGQYQYIPEPPATLPPEKTALAHP